MLRMLVSRLGQGVIVVILVTLFVFLTTFLTGDPAGLMLGEGATQAQIQEFRQRMGFDRPLVAQYGSFLARAVRGDFGVSLYFQQSNMRLFAERLPATLQLAFLSLSLGTALAIPAGLIAGARRNTWIDSLVTNAALVGQAAPVFWVGSLAIMVFAVLLGWLPASGRGTPAHLVLPTLTLALFPLAYNTRLIRSSTLEVLGQDYVRTARAKGLPYYVVLFKHVLRNAIGPALTVIGIQLGTFVGGSVITETVFAWPGVGRLAIQAILTKDFPLLQTIVAFLAVGFVLVNVLVDVAYSFVDPRVRY
ncbi:MAG: ABC transporter permease [Trueperaceae bacterium]|nr:ABC transporter permease [Trueperaceae bacterium]